MLHFECEAVHAASSPSCCFLREKRPQRRGRSCCSAMGEGASVKAQRQVSVAPSPPAVGSSRLEETDGDEKVLVGDVVVACYM